MIKKITLALIICCMFFSCGKKGNPEYKNQEQQTRLQTYPISKT